MIRPTEPWQLQREAGSTRALPEGRSGLRGGGRELSRPVPQPFQLPRSRGGRDLSCWFQLFRTSLPLWLADQGSVVAAVMVARMWVAEFPAVPWIGLLGAILTVVHAVMGLYPGVGLNAVSELQRAWKAWTVTVVVCGLTLLARGATPSGADATLGLTFLGLLIWIPVARRAARRIFGRFRWWSQPALVFGTGDEAATAFGELLRRPQLGLRPVGLVDAPYDHWPDAVPASPWCLVPAHASAETDLSAVFWGVVVVPDTGRELAVVLDRIAESLPHLLVVPSLSSAGRQWHGGQPLGPLSAVRIDVPLLLPGPRLLKRLMDLVITLAIGAVLAPLFLLLVLLVKFTSAGPVLYSHERIGRNGRRFRAWKFRTMRADAEQILSECLARDPQLLAEWKASHKLKQDPRVTAIGWILRKSSLDELPQLWNVLVGEMSLVGPRPIVPAEIPKYGDRFELYCQARPGITGLWQINGRNNISYPQRVQYDSHYVRNWSPWLDCFILARTIKTVLLTEGAY